MKILKTRPAPRGSGTIAFADVEVCFGIKMFGLRVEQRPDQTFRVYSPNANGGRTAAFNPAAVDEIARAVIKFENTFGSEPSADDCITS
ncbi:hypothetical protein [Bradyrhizobium sp. 61]|uniref:hypothetical protein n=1 Tax=unclassified Bradyrhizobium TaxID=2631580 RepID=UPI001FFA05BC|nr:hypothetical protein [Bradyrhizobium sp. 61]MCK1279475.1 hypothetical protein [Bradyrhizobium sp. 61]